MARTDTKGAIFGVERRDKTALTVSDVRSIAAEVAATLIAQTSANPVNGGLGSTVQSLIGQVTGTPDANANINTTITAGSVTQAQLAAALLVFLTTRSNHTGKEIVPPQSYTLAQANALTGLTGGEIVLITDTAGGQEPCWYDNTVASGTKWRRVGDRSIAN
jgi:hypothetical protein